MRIGEEEEAGEEKRWKTGRGKGRYDTRRRGKASSMMSVLSVTLVYCGQTVGWIKMKLGKEVGLVPGDIALDGDSAPPKKGTAAPATFRPMSIVAKRLDQDRHLVRR